VASIAVDPRDPSRWLAGVGNGGVWETRDARRSWMPIADDAPTLSIGAVALAPGNPDVIYAATGEYLGTSIAGHVGVGILKSVNGGQSWALVGQSSFNRTAVLIGRWSFDSESSGLRPADSSLRTFDVKMARHERTLGRVASRR
jgi:hypothetical protein